MSEPRRLIDDAPGALEARLLRVGREGRASHQSRLRTLAALGIAGSAAVAGKSAAATVSAWSLKQLLVGGGLTVAAALGVVALTTDRSSEPAAALEAPAPPSANASEPAEPKVRDVIAPVEVVPSTPVTVEAPAPAVAPRSVPSASIAEELRALDAARSALGAGDATGALARLDEHGRRFPRGSLSLEAEVLRIEALAQSGNRAAAAARARAFVARHPSSVFTPRVRRIAGE